MDGAKQKILSAKKGGKAGPNGGNMGPARGIASAPWLT